MNKISIYADSTVGLECVLFLVSNYSEDIFNIVLTDKCSIIYKELIKIKFDQRKVFFDVDKCNDNKEHVDYIFLLWWPYLIGEKLIKSARYGVVNTHPSLLPHNRGKHFNFWNLVEDVPFGVSLHFVSKGIDNGDVIFQKKINKSWEDNGESLYKKSQIEMLALFKDSYKKIINGEYIKKVQKVGNGSYHNSSELENASEVFLDKQYNAKQLLNLLRARTFPSYNGCYFYEDGIKYEIQINIKKVKQ